MAGVAVDTPAVAEAFIAAVDFPEAVFVEAASVASAEVA